MTIEVRKEGEHPSAHTLSRLHAGELSGEEHDRVRAHLDDCAACRSVFESLEQSRAAFDREHDREDFLRRAEEAAWRPRTAAANQTGGAWWRILLRPVPLAAAAAVLAGVLVLVWWSPPAERNGTTRMKGGTLELGYYVMEPGGPVVAGPDRLLHPGDRIQFRLTAPAGGYVHIVGVDEAGAASVYFPLPGTTPEPFPGGAGRPVPGSIVLDETTGRERIFLLICERPIDRSSLARLAGRHGRALLETERFSGLQGTGRPAGQDPGRCRQQSLLLHKE